MGTFSDRRQESGTKPCASLGSIMNQGGDTHRSSGDDLADLMQQGDTKKPGQTRNSGKGLRGLMGQ